MGVVRDAELNAKTARQAIEDAIAAANIAIDVQTSLFILPGDDQSGTIETLCVNSVRDEPVFACVEEFFACVESHGVKPRIPARDPKSYAQAFLATRQDVQLFPGLAAYRGYWPWNSSVFDPLKDFLRAL